MADPDDPLSVQARQSFGIRYLYPVQRYAISNALESTDQIVVLPTGSGKSLCYQLPALMLESATIVVVPLLSLMNDQLRKLDALGIAAASLRGGQSKGERAQVVNALRSGTVKLIYTTPETLLSRTTAGVLDDSPISHLVIDEAHCVCEWGRSFRPAYLRLGEARDSLRIRSISAFTATASPRVISAIREVLFGSRGVRVYSANPDRPNIHLEAVTSLSATREVVRKVQRNDRPLVVFARSRKSCEGLARSIRRRLPAVDCLFYHAGLDAGERGAVESWFLRSTDGVLVATSAYGMGVDKPDIRSVIHAEVPPSVEAYLQESGRAGRDGQPARACLIHGIADADFGATLADPLERQRYDQILNYAQSSAECRREVLLRCLGIEEVSCSGCDVCSGAVSRIPEGRMEIIAFVRRHTRRLTLRQAAFALWDQPSYEAVRNRLHRLGGSASLSGWVREDIEEALEAMVTAGDLAVPDRGPWKGLLAAPRRAKTLEGPGRPC